MMLNMALIILAAVGVGGLSLATIKGLPDWMRLGHGAAGGVGLLLLLIGALTASNLLIWLAFGLIAAGFAGGALLFGMIYRERQPPGFVIACHGLLNVLGIAALAWAILAP